jgi:hypothetical protein
VRVLFFVVVSRDGEGRSLGLKACLSGEIITDVSDAGDLERAKRKAWLPVRLEGVRLVSWRWRLWGGELVGWVLWERLLGKCEDVMEVRFPDSRVYC